MTKAEQTRTEALDRAKQGQSMSNFPAIIHGFMARGLPESEIQPRVNVFTYKAWQALGRQVRKGEKGVRVTTFVPRFETDRRTGERKQTGSRPWHTTVFHESQTDPMTATQAARIKTRPPKVRKRADAPAIRRAIEQTPEIPSSLFG